MDDDFLNDDDFDYGDDDTISGDDEEEVDMENQYYSGKAAKSESDFAQAKESFEDVLNQEEEKGEWGFKALKQLMKMNFARKQFREFIGYYQRLLDYVKGAVTKNYAEKSITGIIDYVSTLKTEPEFVDEFYTITLVALKELNNERLWFKANSKLGKIQFEKREFEKLKQTIDALKSNCQTKEGEDDQKKGTQLMEIYALEIEMFTELEEFQNLQKTYEKFMKIKSAVPHPVVMGTIKQCGGKMFLRAGHYERAFTDFFDAFKNFDEAGVAQRIPALKYVVIASMLTQSDINPFDSQEAKPYATDPKVRGLVDLIAAYQNSSVDAFQRVIEANPEAMGEASIQVHLQRLLNNVRTQTIVKMVKQYTRVRTGYLAQVLKASQEEVYRILRDAILDNGLSYRIDEIGNMVEVASEQQEGADEHDLVEAVDELTGGALHVFHSVVDMVK